MTFAVTLPWWGWAGLAAALVALVWLAYRHAELPWPRRATLMALRALALAALVLVLLRPVRVEPREDAGGLVPILVDASASMSLTDGGSRSRFDVALDMARAQLAPALDWRFAPRLFTFGERLAPVAEGATPRPDARASRLDEALRDVREHAAGRRLPAIVVLSDGAVSAELAAWAGPPVHVVAVGADRVARDREVFGVSIGDARLQSSLVDVTALVSARGDEREPVDVTLSQNGQPLDVRRVTPSPDGVPRRVTFRVAPARDTATLYTVEAAPAEGEWTGANNRQTVLAAPAGPPRRVLLIEGAPGHEHSFLKRSLDDDPGLQLDAIVRKGENDRGEATFYVQAASDRADALAAGFPSTREALYAYDAVLLANVDAALLAPAALAQLADFVSQRGGGLLVLGAKAFEAGGLAGTPLEDALPVELTDRAGGLVRAARGAREPHRVELTDAGVDHPVMRQGGVPGDTRRVWDAAPPLAAAAALGPPRPGALLLAATTVTGGVSRPLVAVQRYGRGRVLLFGGEASWRWKMMSASTDATYDTFWRQAVRWSAADAQPPVALALRPPDGRRVRVAAEVRDAAFARVADAAVRLRVTTPSGRAIDVPVERDPSGVVTAAIEVEESGVHKVTLDARRGDMVLGAAEAWALVGGVDGEFVDPRRDLEVLRRVADATGGRLARAEEGVPDIGAWVAARRTPDEELVQREVWHTPWAWALLVGLLGVEWALRRQWGLK